MTVYCSLSMCLGNECCEIPVCLSSCYGIYPPGELVLVKVYSNINLHNKQILTISFLENKNALEPLSLPQQNPQSITPALLP